MVRPVATWLAQALTLVSGLVSVLAHEPLRVSLQDLHTAGTKGKWWLVGAAWGGDPLVDHQAEAPEQRVLSTTEAVESKLLKLARKQGMNTDVRRSIFVVLMSSDVRPFSCGGCQYTVLTYCRITLTLASDSLS